MIIIVVIVLAAFLFFMIVIYKRMVRRELAKQMDSQINNLVSQYFAMNDSKERGYNKVESNIWNAIFIIVSKKNTYIYIYMYMNY